jgi:D-amino-acid oxidase
MDKVTVVGAGVIGLTAAVALQKAGYVVDVIAEKTSPDTTSDVAAAFWYPYLCNPRDKALAWSKFTRDYLVNEIVPNPDAGCSVIEIAEYFDEPQPDVWWHEAALAYRKAQPEELKLGYKDGFVASTILMDTSIYMNFLMNMFEQGGGTVRIERVSNLNDIEGGSRIVINCTGIGAHDLCHDERTFPIRGQVVRAKPIALQKIEADASGHNNLAYIAPRSNDVILGGTDQEGNWSLEVDERDTDGILRRTASLNGLTADPGIVETKVGLRPGRDEIRLETEKLSDDRVIVHNYGHGGAGFTLSWGCADEVVHLVKQQFDMLARR